MGIETGCHPGFLSSPLEGIWYNERMKRRLLLVLAPIFALLSCLGLHGKEGPRFTLCAPVVKACDATLHVDVLNAGTPEQVWSYTLYRQLPDHDSFVRVDMISKDFLNGGGAARLMDAELDKQDLKRLVAVMQG